MGSTEDRDRVIDASEQAVESTPVDHPNRPGYLNSLDCALRSRYDRTGLMEDLDRAIDPNQ
jgi:hypothetical protein